MGFDFVLMSYGYLKNETIPSVDLTPGQDFTYEKNG